MACQKISQTRKGGYKSEGKCTKPHPCIFLTLKRNCSGKDVGCALPMYTVSIALCCLGGYKSQNHVC